MKAVALASLALVATTVLSGQQQRPVFRGSTALVPITVTVTDQQGKPVTGLTQADFKIFEDGRPREVVTFFPQQLTAGPVTEPTMAIARKREAGIVPATRRTFVLVLGFGRIQEPTKALDGAMKFVREHLLPQDAIAVMGLHRTTALTTDHDAILQLLTRYKKEHERMVWDILSFFRRVRVPGVCGGPPIPPEMLAGFDRDLFDGVMDPARIRNTMDLLFGMEVGGPTGEKPGQRRQTFQELLKAVERGCANLSDVVVTSSRLKLYAAIEYLRYVDGEKHVVILSNTSIAQDADRAREVAARANDARVTVDYVSTAGMYLSRNAQFSSAGCLPCRDVAKGTGGFYSSVDYMDKALAKVDQWSRSSYLLGYAPASAELDGGYRRVRVEVNRRKVTVNHRNGYFALEEPAEIGAREIVEEARSSAARRYDADASDIAVNLVVKAAVVPRGTEAGSVTVDVTVGMAALPLELANGMRTGQLEVSVYCGDAQEQVVGQTEVQWNLKADAATYADWLKNGLTRTLTVPVTAAAKYVKVLVYDRQSDRVGSKTVTINAR
ncbi:MAG TPA: VWA domain-containing protein [Vicinamibacterales bacterium]|nr:VWA domain-containing protein [Vicinamibacterales bacterium]